MSAMEAFGALSELAEDQWGLVTNAQARSVGVASSTLARLAAPGSSLERIAHGVYRVRGAVAPELLELRAAWLQLAPQVPAWRRTPTDGVVSHRSAAAVLHLGDLPADRHEFTFAQRRQSRRSDVHFYRRSLQSGEWTRSAGDSLLYTRPARIIADLLVDHDDPSAVATIVAEALERGLEHPETMVTALNPFAERFGLRHGNGQELLSQFLDTSGVDPTSANSASMNVQVERWV